MTQGYQGQSGLLLEVPRIAAKSKVFTLKGGTAINFFFQDCPRLRFLSYPTSQGFCVSSYTFLSLFNYSLYPSNKLPKMEAKVKGFRGAFPICGIFMLTVR